MKTKSLSKKIVVFTITSVFVILFLLMAYVSFIVREMLFATTTEHLKTMSRLSATTIEGHLNSFLNTVTTTAAQLEEVDPRSRGTVSHALCSTFLKQNPYAQSVWVELLENEIYGDLRADSELAEVFGVPTNYIGFEDIYYLRQEGGILNDTSYDNDYISEAYFQDSQSRSSPYITEPYYDQYLDAVLLSAISPVQDADGRFLGLVGIDFDDSSLRGFQLPQNNFFTSFCYLSTEDGTIIMHSGDPGLVGKNTRDLGDQTDKLLVQAPVAIGNSGQQWVATSGVARAEVDKNVRAATTAANVGGLILQIILTILLYRMLRRNLRPVKMIADKVRLLAEGDLGVSIDYSSNDELGQLCGDFNQMAAALQSYVEDISQVLTGMANNDLTVTPQVEYAGDFVAIRHSLQGITEGLTHSVAQIAATAQQVNSSTALMSDSSQSLAQNSTQQAATVEELLSQMERVGALALAARDKANATKSLADSSEEGLRHSNQQMQQLVVTIEDLNHQSDRISKIIGVIDSIAFQTNILALNAAVEAARAGAAGKGFAVVADEVRNLAGKSAEAAKDTATLIQSSIDAIRKSVDMAVGAADTLSQLSQRTQDTQQNVQQILEGAQEQAQALGVIQGEVEQLSGTAMGNSATSEESAAIARELRQQGDNLLKLVDRYKLHC